MRARVFCVALHSRARTGMPLSSAARPSRRHRQFNVAELCDRAIVPDAKSRARISSGRLARPGAGGRDSLRRCGVAEEEGVDRPGRLKVGEVRAREPAMRRLERLRVVGQLERGAVCLALPAPRERRPERQPDQLEHGPTAIARGSAAGWSRRPSSGPSARSAGAGAAPGLGRPRTTCISPPRATSSDSGARQCCLCLLSDSLSASVDD
jgi:hypothetical protein